MDELEEYSEEHDIVREMPQDVWTMIFQYRSVEEILHLCASNKLYSGLCQNEQLWKLLIERDYEFAIGANLSDWNIDYNEEIYKDRPYYETYIATNIHIHGTANYLYSYPTLGG